MDKLIALVTGANKGIGREIARELAGQGFVVYVCARDEARGEAAAAQIGGDVRPLVLDVTRPESIAAAAAAVDALDVLVNNAGISGENRNPVEEEMDGFRRVYETNVFGVLAVTKAFLPVLRRSAHPRIVNISSGTASLAGAVARPSPAAVSRRTGPRRRR